MEIPYISGDRTDPDWIADYMRAGTHNQNEFNKAAELRFHSEVYERSVDLLLKFTDFEAMQQNESDGTLSLSTPPIVYTLYGKSVVKPDDAYGIVWLRGEFSTLPDNGLILPKVSFSIWAQVKGNNQPVWIMKTRDSHILRNTLSGEVDSYSHGDINRFRGIVDDIDDAIFGEQKKAEFQERQAENKAEVMKKREITVVDNRGRYL